MDPGPYPDRSNWTCLSCRDDPAALLDHHLDWADFGAETSLWRFLKSTWPPLVFGSWIWVPPLLLGYGLGEWWWAATIACAVGLVVLLLSDMGQGIVPAVRATLGVTNRPASISAS
jgi:hypothetical protein